MLGHPCAGFEQDSSGVVAYFRSRRGEDLGSIRADVLIGADGVRSSIREQFLPGRGAPTYSGVTLWRGVTRAPRYLSGGAVLHIGALRTGILPATLNLETPDETASAFDLVAKTARAKEVAHAVVNAFGFGGVNASLVLSRL